jgi:hypothetical protein
MWNYVSGGTYKFVRTTTYPKRSFLYRMRIFANIFKRYLLTWCETKSTNSKKIHQAILTRLSRNRKDLIILCIIKKLSTIDAIIILRPCFSIAIFAHPDNCYVLWHQMSYFFNVKIHPVEWNKDFSWYRKVFRFGKILHLVKKAPI